MATVEPSETRDRVESLVAVCRGVLQREGLESLQAAFLYGSSLERGFRADSDIDLAVLDDAGQPLSWSDQARLMDALERALGKSIDLRRLRESSPSHQAHVLEQGRLLWSRNPGLVDRYALEIQPAVRSERRRVDQEWPQALDRLATRVR